MGLGAPGASVVQYLPTPDFTTVSNNHISNNIYNTDENLIKIKIKRNSHLYSRDEMSTYVYESINTIKFFYCILTYL